MIKVKQIKDFNSKIQEVEDRIKQSSNDTYESKFDKNTAFNKDFGNTEGTVAEGNHKHNIASSTENGLMSSDMFTKLEGIEDNANNYTHPDTHPATMIEQTEEFRFVTDAEKDEWNKKETIEGSQQKADKALEDAKEYVDSKLMNNNTILHGNGVFNSIEGITISLGSVAPNINYIVNISPSSDPDGGLGEYWVGEKTTTTFKVYCSGSTTNTAFDWMVMIDNTRTLKNGMTLKSGHGTFNSLDGVTINIGESLPSTNYMVNISPSSDPNGELGEYWISDKTNNSFKVYCSGSTTDTLFDWMVML